MPVVRIELNTSGVGDLLRSGEVLDDLERRARAIASAAGPGMEASAQVGRTRARASVITGDLDAMRAEATDRSLTHAVDAGRA